MLIFLTHTIMTLVVKDKDIQEECEVYECDSVSIAQSMCDFIH